MNLTSLEIHFLQFYLQDTFYHFKNKIMKTLYKSNTTDFYLDHLYRQYNSELWNKYNNLKSVLKCEIGTSFGNFQISTKDIFIEKGPENLKFKNVGYGKLQFMGIAVYFKDKNMTELYYKNDEEKKAIESFIKSIDRLNEEKRENTNFIEKQHGKPKTQHSIIWARITGLI